MNILQLGNQVDNQKIGRYLISMQHFQWILIFLIEVDTVLKLKRAAGFMLNVLFFLSIVA
jgi:hypothetical protein